MSPTAHDDLKKGLDQIAAGASRQLEHAQTRDAVRSGVGRALTLFLIVPVVAILVQGLRLLIARDSGGAGGSGNSGGWFTWWLVPCTVLPPMAYLFWRQAAARTTVPKRQALAAVDARLDNQDRLLTAEEFLAEENKSGFMLAAIEDAQVALHKAQGADVAPAAQQVRVSMLQRVLAPIGVALLGMAFWLSLISISASLEAEDSPALVANSADVAGRTRTDDVVTTPDDREEPMRAASEENAERRAASRSNSNAPVSDELPDVAEEAVGSMGTGQTSESDQSSNPSNARGAPSAQGQPSKPGESPKKKPGRNKARSKDDQQQERPQQQEEQPAGSTAGQGSSKGSNKNPAVSDWSSRDHITTPDDDQVDEQDDVEDEEEEQESRGGVQPNLRDRRPPVNRDLRIGFGNNKSPDANGRGGPSQQKKSRGVASFVLGVPIPDRVKGQPNAGKTKVTQQRIEPEPEEADSIAAQPRSPRTGDVGPVYHPVMSPWLRTLVKSYFLEQRQSAQDTED